MTNDKTFPFALGMLIGMDRLALHAPALTLAGLRGADRPIGSTVLPAPRAILVGGLLETGPLEGDSIH